MHADMQGRKRQEGLVEKLLRKQLSEKELEKLEVSVFCLVKTRHCSLPNL